MKKTIVKILCAALAVCMLLSGTVSVFASDATYTAQYGDKNSKEVYSAIINDADKLISDQLFTGETIEQIWIAMGNMVLYNAETYEQMDEELLGNLSEYLVDNGYSTNEIIGVSFERYFSEHPVTVESPEYFAEHFKIALNEFIDCMVPALIYPIISIVAMVNMEEVTNISKGLDDICAAIGVEQDKAFYDVLKLDQSEQVSSDETLMAEVRSDLLVYVNNLLDAVLPDTTDNVIGILQRIMLPENSAKLYSGISGIFGSIDVVLLQISELLGGSIDLSSVQDIIAEANEALEHIPLNDDGSVEWNGALGYIVNGVVIPMLAPGMSLQVISFGEDENYPNAILKFSAMNPANLSEADDTADALNVAMHYLYENINANKAKIDFLVNDVLPGLVTLPQEVTDIVNMITSNTESDAVWNIYSLLHVAAGYDEPVYEEPVTDPETPPSEDKPNTDKPNTDVPGGDKPAGTTPEQNSNGGENKPVLNSSNPNLPNTGAEEMTAAFIVIPLAAAGAFMLAVVLRKRALDK